MKTIDISGMGGGYETACQKMLIRGLKWLKEHPHFDFKAYRQYQNVYGVVDSTTQDAKELDKYICEGVDPSGAMHQAVINHLAYIHVNGYDRWLESAGPDRVVEQQTEEEINKILHDAQVAWEKKLASGYNPLEGIPKDQIVEVDFNDPVSMKKAAEAIAKAIKESRDESQK